MDKFEKYIQQKFENFSPKPSDELWLRIQSKIQPWYAQPLLQSLIVLVLSGAFFIAVALGINRFNQNHKNNIQIPQTTVKTTIKQTYNNKQTVQRHQQPQQKIIVTAARRNQNNHKTSTKYSKNKATLTQNTITNRIVKVGEPKFFHDSTLISTDNSKIPYTAPTKQHLKFRYYITPTEGCAPLRVTLFVEPPKGMNISWFIDKKQVSKQPEFEYTFNPGLHYIELVIFDSIQTVVIYDTVNVLPKPKAQFDVGQCSQGQEVKINNLSKNGKIFVWYFGDGDSAVCDTPVHIYSNSGYYNIQLIARNELCADTFTKIIHVAQAEQNIVFPNAFVPNLTGPTGGYYNPNSLDRSIFHPIAKKPVVEYHLTIYDRRGRKIFETNDIKQGWDGYFRGKLVPVGVYIYIASGRFEDGQKFVKKGDITVIYQH